MNACMLSCWVFSLSNVVNMSNNLKSCKGNKQFFLAIAVWWAQSQKSRRIFSDDGNTSHMLEAGGG